LNTSPQHKQNWKKPELERRSWSKEIKNSSKKWSNKLKKHIEWWNKWWRCSKNKPNLSCTTLACLFLLFVSLHVSELLLLTNNYCFWTMFMLLNCFYVMIYDLWLHNFSLRFSHLFLFVFILYLFVNDKRGSICIIFRGSEPH